jgi:DNA-binding protein YbaB
MNMPSTFDPFGGADAFQRVARQLQLPTDLRQIPRLMAEFQASIEAAAREFAEQTFDGHAAVDGVVATVTASGQVTGVHIGVLAKRRTDNLTLGEAVVEAVRNAQTNAREAWTQRMASLTLFGVPAVSLLSPPEEGPTPRE